MSDDSRKAKSPNSDVRLRVAGRMQVVWKAQCVDDLLAADHPTRAVWAVVRRAGFGGLSRADQGTPGRPGAGRHRPAGAGGVAAASLVAGRGFGAARRGAARELARLCGESRPCQWLRGGVTVNHHLLSDSRVGRAAAPDGLFTDVIATLVKKGLVKVKRVSQDGLRVRASAGSASFRRGTALTKLQQGAAEHVRQLRALLDNPEESAGSWSATKKKAMGRAARGGVSSGSRRRRSRRSPRCGRGGRSGRPNG